MKVTASIRDRDLPRRIRNRWARRRPRRALDVIRAVVRDGDHIWVTADFPTAGGLAAIDTASGERSNFSPRVEPGLQTVSLPVAELPGDEERSFRLVFHGGQPDRPLYDARVTPFPTRAPVATGGRWRFEVTRGPRGLEVQRERERAFVAVCSLDEADGFLQVAWASGDGTDLLARASDGPEVTVPVSVDGDRAVARIGPEIPSDGPLTLMVRSGERTVPLGRPQNDLRRPNAAVLLPEIDTESSRLRFLWSPSGLLEVQRRAPQ